jgi:hexosaminidase
MRTESYSIEVGDNKAALVAATAVGAIRGLETVLQLVEGDRQGFYLPAVTVVDKPRFPWRGS